MRGLPAVSTLLFLLLPAHSFAYSVLTHEAVIDSVWDGSIKPLLLSAYPKASPDDLTAAHGYAYGGAIIQDFGYYPRGSKLFSDLAHYVRTGDFIIRLIADAQSLNEYAFALGSLAHYASDEQGHSVAVNRAVPMLYPKLAKKFGSVVTYEDNPGIHLKMEFAFDVEQVARGYYAPPAYHGFIGFQVARPVLERAFEETYCLKMSDLFSDLDHAISSYRHIVGRTIPEATKIAWVMKRQAITAHYGEGETKAKRRFLYNLSRSSYEKEWGSNYDKPTLKDRFLAILMWIIPKVGPLRALAFKPPTPQAEELFMRSFDLTIEQYKTLLTAAGNGSLRLRELNLDTGLPTGDVPYAKAEETRAQWDRQRNGVGCPVPHSLRAPKSETE